MIDKIRIKIIKMKNKLCVFLLLFLLRPVHFATVITAQVPIGIVLDAPLLIPNSITGLAEIVTNFLLKAERPLQENIQKVGQFFQKANSIVNGAIANMRMVKNIIETQKDITDLFERSVNRINNPVDLDGDGIDYLEVLNKWKEIQILLGYTKEATAIFEIFTNIIEDDALNISDKGRIVFIEKTYRDMKLLKASMRGQLRRINKKVYEYRSKRRQLKMYSIFFS